MMIFTDLCLHRFQIHVRHVACVALYLIEGRPCFTLIAPLHHKIPGIQITAQPVRTGVPDNIAAEFANLPKIDFQPLRPGFRSLPKRGGRSVGTQFRPADALLPLSEVFAESRRLNGQARGLIVEIEIMIGPHELHFARKLPAQVVLQRDNSLRFHFAPNTDLVGEEPRRVSIPTADLARQRAAEVRVGRPVGDDQLVESNSVTLDAALHGGNVFEILHGGTVEIAALVRIGHPLPGEWRRPKSSRLWVRSVPGRFPSAGYSHPFAAGLRCTRPPELRLIQGVTRHHVAHSGWATDKAVIRRGRGVVVVQDPGSDIHQARRNRPIQGDLAAAGSRAVQFGSAHAAVLNIVAVADEDRDIDLVR